MDKLIKKYQQDPNRKSKNAKRGNTYTKSFLKWNKDQLKQGKTTLYAIKDKVYNPKTDRFITLKYKKSATKNKILTNTSKGLKRFQNVLIDYIKIKLNENTVSSTKDGNTSSWFKNIIKTKNIFEKKTRWFIKNDKTKDIVVDADLPSLTKKTLNKYFRDFNDFLKSNESPESGLFMHFYVVYELLSQDFSLYITEDIEIQENVVKQSFAEGDYCLLKHVYNWIEYKIEESNTDATKKKYEAKRNKFKTITQKSGKVKVGYWEKYKDGIPQDDLSTLVNDLQIHIKIQKPFNPDIYLNIKSTKKPLRTFAYTNTRLNHVEKTPLNYFNKIFTDNYKDDLVICDNFSEMTKIKNTLKHGEWIGTSSKHGYKTIKTLDNIYRVDEDFDIESTKFEDEIGCKTNDSDWSFDSIKHKELGKFIDQGTHFSGTIDFDDNFHMYGNMKQNILNGLRHYDQTKAYANFDKTKYYTGFMSSPAEFRKVDNFKRKGFYLIDNINIHNSKFEILNSKLNWFLDWNIYTDSELNALKDYATFTIICGAMGNKADFRFNETMKNKKVVLHKFNDKEIKLPYYSKWVGRCAINSHYQTFVMTGSKEYFQNIATNKSELSYNEFKQEATIKYPKKSAKTLKHIAAQITAYQRLVMLEQLMKMDISKIVRVCVDGIYFFDKDNIQTFDTIYDTNDFKVWSNKTQLKKMTLNNSPTENYLSNLYDKNDNIQTVYDINNGYDTSLSIRNTITTATGKKRDYYRNELHRGAGGTGKTTINMLDEGLIDVCYIAPSWKLARQMETDFKNKFNKKIDVNVYYRLMNEPYRNSLRKKYKNFLLDEASQRTERDKRILLNIDANRLIFVGDFGYQLPPAIDRKKYPLESNPDMIEMTPKGIEHIVDYTEQKRTKCQKLKQLLSIIRQLIKSKSRYNQVIPILKRFLPTITRQQLIQEYKREDTILCSQHNFKDEYTELFKDIEKYYVTENNSLYQNGMIIFNKEKDVKSELRHAYTIHSIQGETAENNLYIDTRRQKSLRMIYTAISRAKYISQVKLI